MRIFKTVFFITLLGQSVFSQEINTNKSFLVNKKEIKEIHKEIYDLNLIYDLNVFDYYELNQYDTELRKKVFKKSKEYSEKLVSLKMKKDELFNTTYFFKWDETLSDYDISKRGFFISLGINMNLGTGAANSPKTINDIYFPSLSTKNIAYLDNAYGRDVKEEVLFLNIDEKTGTKMENNSKDISIYLIFKICGKQKIGFKYNSMGDGWYNITQEHFSTNNVRLIIADDKTGEIYFEKGYK